MKSLNRIFYIYTEAGTAVFMAIGAIIELLCGAAIGGFMQMYIANPAAGVFLAIALGNVWYIYRSERKYARFCA